jgi:AcrR family transcriptional regulator
LIDAAIGMFAAKGFSGTTVGEIASAAAISKKTVYKHVTSKIDLFTVAVEDFIRRTIPGDLVLPDPAEDTDPAGTLHAAMGKIVAVGMTAEGMAVWRLIARDLPSFPELEAAYNRPMLPFIASLIRWLAGQAERGWLTIASPEYAAQMLVTMVMAAPRRDALLARPPADPATQARIAAAAVDLFLNGARSRAGR